MRVDALIKKMTLKEKVSFFVGYDDWQTRAIDRLGIPPLRVTDGPHGTRFVTVENKEEDVGLPATCFPTASAMAATWNIDLISQVGVALGIETKAKGAHILLGPAVNIHRTPLGGRNFEYFSEDPYLSGRLAVAYIKGIQSQGVGVSIKHYACNNSEYERMTISSELDERVLREIYLPAFRAAVLEANPWTVMCSYNKINGTYASENYYLLTEILKNEWDFEGFVISDWGAVHDRIKSANAGLDLEMPGQPDLFPEELFKAVKKKIVREDVLDDKIRRIFNIMDKAGIFDGTRQDIHSTNTKEQQQIAFEAACESMVLLKNERQVLPINTKRIKRIGVFGNLAMQPTIEGGGSSRVTPYYVSSPLEVLQQLCKDKAEVVYESGTFLAEDNPDQTLIEKMAKLAGKMDIALVFAGYPEYYETEGADRRNMDLPADQVELINIIADANRNAVVVLQNGSPVNISPWIDKVPGVVESWYAGQESGSAIAAILMGNVNPSGKLPISIPKRRIDHSDYLNYPGESGKVLYGEGLFVGYRYYDVKDVDPLFPFGYGLSYTNFEYGKLDVDSKKIEEGKPVQVEFELTNSGKYRGKEVVQLYVHDVESCLVRPIKELKGFQKIDLEAGEKKHVKMDLTLWDLAYYDPVEKVWIAENGDFEVWIGSSSRDIRLKAIFSLSKTVALDEKGRIIRTEKGYRLSADSLVKDIVADNEGLKILNKYMGNVEKDPRLKIARDYTLRQVSMYAPGELPVEVVKKIDRELRTID